MSKSRLLAAIAIYAGLSAESARAQNAFPPIRDWNSVTITLERGYCLFRCPAYTVEVHGDGTVSYQGRYFVAIPGHQETKIPVEAVRELTEQFRSAGYFGFEDTYRSPITDQPTVTTRIEFDGVQKAVVDYAGIAVGMPRAILDLEAAIDRIAGTERWVNP